MTAQEVAEVLRVKPATVVKWRSRGGGPPFIYVEGQARYVRTDFAEWLDGREVHAPKKKGSEGGE
jgi:hypothetical protein